VIWVITASWSQSLAIQHKLWALLPKDAITKRTHDSYTPKHFRKSATTQINLHRAGMAPFIVGHAERRASSSDSISSRHYDNKEQSVVECVMTMPVPERFTSWNPQIVLP
jgi:hypothetical protein